jgi:Uma2 family endonuclease
MGEPAWKLPPGENDEPDDDDTGTVLVQRWVERPDGGFELLEWPPTVEDYLDPQLEDKLTQGRPHAELCHLLFELLSRFFKPDEEIVVLQDVKILLGPGLPGPSPDIAVIRGARDKDFWTFRVVDQGVLPHLVIEVISPRDARVRQMDQVNKLELYQRVGIPEYLLVDFPRRATGHRFRVKGYRLGPGRRYEEIAPDGKGRLLSETTGLRFGASEDGQQIEIFDPNEARILTAQEVSEGATREAKARQAVEDELVRLRAEIERLRNRE